MTGSGGSELIQALCIQALSYRASKRNSASLNLWLSRGNAIALFQVKTLRAKRKTNTPRPVNVLLNSTFVPRTVNVLNMCSFPDKISMAVGGRQDFPYTRQKLPFRSDKQTKG